MMKNRIFLIMLVLLQSACQWSKSKQIKDFEETYDSLIGVNFSNGNKSFKKEFLNKKVIRYYFNNDDPNYIGGKGCKTYEDVNLKTNKIIGWGYVSSPDKCRSKIGWGGPW